VNAVLFTAIVLAGRLDAPVAETTLALVLVVGVTVARLPWHYAVLTGLTAWACLTGFVVNELGQLTFAGADLVRLLVLVAVSAAVAVLDGRSGERSRQDGAIRRQGSVRATVVDPTAAVGMSRGSNNL
jgi:hypothetical protein